MNDILIVTGASSGMGRDFVYVLEREYSFDEIWVIARREERLEEIKSTLGKKVVPLALDLTKEESIETVDSLLKDKNVRVKGLVNASGYGIFKAFEDSDRKETEGIVDLNDRALVAMTHISLPYMDKGSFIINMGSNSSHQPVPYMAVYAASKAFVLSFSLSLSAELKKRGIKVICVCPGWIKTEFFERARKDDTTIVYYDRYYESKDVVERAVKDLKKGKTVSILGLPVRNQVRLVKFLPKSLVMRIWLKQQKKL